MLWATLAGIAIEAISGAALGHLGWRLRSEPNEHMLMNDFLGLGLIGVAYGLSLLVGAWGFLAMFFAAVALRQTELKLAGADRQRGLTGIQGTSGTALGTGAHPVDRRHAVSRFLELARRGTHPVPVLGGTPGERLRRPVGHADFVADTRHGRLIRGARHRFAVLPDVRHPAWSSRRSGPGSNPVDADCGHTFDPGPRHQRQAAMSRFKRYRRHLPPT